MAHFVEGNYKDLHLRDIQNFLSFLAYILKCTDLHLFIFFHYLFFLIIFHFKIIYYIIIISFYNFLCMYIFFLNGQIRVTASHIHFMVCSDVGYQSYFNTIYCSIQAILWISSIFICQIYMVQCASKNTILMSKNMVYPKTSAFILEFI